MAELPIASSVPGGDGAAEAAPSTDIGPAFDFSSLRDKAMASFGSEPAAPATPETPVTPVEGTPAVVEEPAAAERKPVSLKDEDFVEVVVDGTPQLMSYKDAKAGWSRTAKFTQEMQQVRQREAELEQRAQTVDQIVEQRDTLVSFLKNKDLVSRYMQEVFGQAQQQAAQQLVAQGADPGEVATLQEAEAIAARHVQGIEQRLQETVTNLHSEISRATQELEDKREIAAFASELDTHVDKIFSENPVLKVIPNANELVRYEVSKMHPRNIAEAKQMFIDVTQSMVEGIRSQFVSQNKQAVVEKQKLTTINLEPPGGSAPVVAPTSYKGKDGKVDWNALRATALTYLNQK
jgi:hypothetical protein